MNPISRETVPRGTHVPLPFICLRVRRRVSRRTQFASERSCVNWRRVSGGRQGEGESHLMSDATDATRGRFLSRNDADVIRSPPFEEE